jgi:monooxygenase
MADTEHLDVLIVGAGLSGVGAARRLRTECPQRSFAILEARDAVGGTWDLMLNRGPLDDGTLELRRRASPNRLGVVVLPGRA